MTDNQTPLWAVDNRIDIVEKRDNLGELLLLSAFFLYSIKYIFDFSGIFIRTEMLNTVLVVLSYALVTAKIIFFQKYTLKRLIITAVVVLVLVISSQLGMNNHMQMGLFFIVAMQDVDLKKVVKLGFRFKVAVIAIHVVWYAFIYATDPSAITFSFRAGGGAPRHYFFMGHANTFSAILLWASFEYIFYKYDKLRFINLFAVCLIFLIFYTFTASHSALVVLLLSTVLIAFDKILKKPIDKQLTFFTRFMYPSLAAIFALLSVLYTRLHGTAKDLIDGFDNMLTGRLWPGAYAYDMYGFTLMGQRIRPMTSVYWHNSWRRLFVPFDNNYLANLYHYGIIHLIVTSIALIALAGKMENREKIIMIAFSSFAIMQSDVTNLVVCFALLIIGKYIYAENSRNNNR